MADIRIDAEPRNEFGKGAARRARRAGKIPAVLYGHGTDPRHFTLPALEFARVLRENGRNAVLTVSLAGEDQLALTKTVVTHPIRNYIEHVDLLVIRRGEKVTVEVPIVLSGETASGTLVTQDLGTLEVEADVSSIPDRLEVDLSGAEVGTQILAGQVSLPVGVTLKTDADHLVVNVVAAPTAEEMDGPTDPDAVVEAEAVASAEDADAPADGDSD